jgi:hypothetical protein
MAMASYVAVSNMGGNHDRRLNDHQNCQALTVSLFATCLMTVWRTAGI